MAIQIAGGTIVNATSSTLAARSDMQAFVRDNLITAGWSVVSGGGTGDTLLQSATTPQGLRCQLRCFDPGSGNCAQFTMRDVAGLTISNIAYMLPTNGKQFRIIANKYQFFVFSSGGASATNAREIMAGGVPWVPANIVAIISNADCFWFQFTGDTDITTTARLFHFRNQLFSNTGTSFPGSASLFNGTLVNYSVGNASTTPPSLHLSGLHYANTGSPGTPQWRDGSYPVRDAEVSWSSSSTVNAVPMLIGQLWDAAIICINIDGESMELIPPDTTAKYMTISHQNTNTTGCTLVVRVLA